jgi:hypothetical protein
VREIAQKVVVDFVLSILQIVGNELGKLGQSAILNENSLLLDLNNKELRKQKIYCGR